MLLGVSVIVPSKPLETPVDRTLEAVRELAPADRAWAAHQLAHLEPPEPDVAVPVLLALLADPSPLVRARAAEGLSHFYEQAETILKRLQLPLHDGDAQVRECAFIAVARLAPAGDSVATLRAGLVDGDSVIRKEAELALRRVSTSR